MSWVLAVAGFVAQLLACIYGKSTMGRLLPVLFVVGLTVLTLIGTFGGGILAFLGGTWLLLGEGKILFAMALAIGIYKIASFTK